MAVFCNFDTKPGYAGVPNPLYDAEHVLLMLGDAKTSVQQLLEQLLQETGAQEYVLTSEDLAAIAQLREARYDTWLWNFGTSPECTLSKKARVEGCGTVECRMTVKDGRITAAAFRGDFFSSRDPQLLADRFVGLRPVSEDYQKALEWYQKAMSQGNETAAKRCEELRKQGIIYNPFSH